MQYHYIIIPYFHYEKDESKYATIVWIEDEYMLYLSKPTLFVGRETKLDTLLLVLARIRSF